MSYLRIMASKPLLCFAIWTTAAATYASAATSTLTSEITDFVPSCALDCFQSFVSNNYNAAGCGTSPALACLCQKTGTSGFTIGEGAVQCLVAEINRNSCQGGDASQQAISKAYAMCSGVQNAAPETHATIVATLVVPSGTGPVQVPGAASTTVASLPTSTPVSTSDAVSITPIATVSSTASPAVSTTSATSSPSSTSDGTSRGPTLNTAQIAGISVGIAATLGFAIGLIFLARCVRRRNFGDQESILFKPKRESKGFGMLKSNQNSPGALQISAPIHKTPIDMEFRRPGDFQRQRKETIGLALSPPRSAAATAQGSRVRSPMSADQPPKTYKPYTPDSHGLPKPALTVIIPQDSGQPQKEARNLQSSRDSVVTEFQEDGEGESVGGSNIWRPPPTDPQSTTTYYVADKWGNWILSNKDRTSNVAELPSSVNRTKAERAMDANPESPVDRTMLMARGTQLSKPGSTRQTGPGARLGPPIELKDKLQAPRSSSVYSNFSLPQSVAPGSGNHLPVTSVSLAQENSAAGTKGQEASKRRKSKGASRQNKRRSQDSATTIASSVAEVDEEGDAIEDDPQDGLSPVVESPRTPVSSGRSPVTYPKLPAAARDAPDRRKQQGHKQLPTPPKTLQPTLTLFPRNTRNEPLGTMPLDPLRQPSPTLGTVDVSPLKGQRNPAVAQRSSTAKQQFMRVPALNPNPPRNPAEFKTGSPEMRSGLAPPEGEKQEQYQHHHRRGSSLQQPQQELLYQQSSWSNLHPVQGQGDSRSSASQAQLSRSRLPDRILISPASATTNGSVESAGSSFLLTKRLGADRAAALTLGEDLGGQSARRVKWQRDQEGPGFIGRETAAALPATPGWLPKLTPTRRGDDLFLNVQ
ncbi:hypothetical protein CONLIGDRAFT_399892 [Coniochaeta ligniaria NRRL 30616]|uniref:Extracellular membrane protein CFEM domain-containing protein n=1 Tax=Coniochaeta ligniaria NRRL 30616 TaxID=1408157 RepID=A0A1J7J6M4_9PEZI|nr:hypothetical protein CONLIGDRAFT_399892 [Coniochaeta ligniaria NRRL 30616]